MHNQYLLAPSTGYASLRALNQALAQLFREPHIRPMSHDFGFPPIARPDARVLILGSLPGQRSLQMHQYYAHPQNAFWKVMARVFEFESTLPYTRRVEILTENCLALWD